MRTFSVEYLSKTITARKRLRQIDPLTTRLFNLVLKAILQKSDILTDGIIYYKKQQVIAYADDIALVTRWKVK